MDMYTHLQEWLEFYRSQTGRDFKPTDKLFPYIAPNGQLEPGKEMAYNHFAKIMKRWTEGAGLRKTYTTHSFRRGGAQYRFMFAPFHRRWTLHRVRWWGGWAIGESVSNSKE